MAKDRQRVLVVDDEAALREQYIRLLNEQLFVARGVESGAEAIRDLRSGVIDLVIADESMSDMDGFSFLRELRDNDVDIPAILLTTVRDNETTLRARECGALCLAKPIEAETLVAAAQQCLEGLSSSAIDGARHHQAGFFETVTATVAKNEFGRVMDVATRTGRVMITKHKAPRAVLMSFEEYSKLVEAGDPDLDALAAEFDDLVTRMQTRAAREATDALFSMSSEELGAAAVTAAKTGA